MQTCLPIKSPFRKLVPQNQKILEIYGFCQECITLGDFRVWKHLLEGFCEFFSAADKGRLLSMRVVTSNASALVALSASATVAKGCNFRRRL